MMTSGEKFVHKFMNATEKVKNILGPADHGDVDDPVVHRHDDFEDNSDEQLRNLEERTDSEGHHYAVIKDKEATEEP